MGKWGKVRQKPFRQIQAYSRMFRHISAYSDISRHNQAYSEPFVNLAYSELWYIQNPGIFKTKGIFRTLVYLKLCHIQNQKHIENPGLFRTLGYLEPEAQSEPCQTSTTERFEKELTAMLIFASYNFISQYQLFIFSKS